MLASPNSGIRTGMNGISALSRLEPLSHGHIAGGAGERLVESGGVRIDFRRDKGAADAPFGVRGSKLRRIEADLGDDPRIARGGALGRAVDGRKRPHLAAVHLIERTVDDGGARCGVEIVRGRSRAWRGRRAQGLAGLIDRMRLHRPRLGAKDIPNNNGYDSASWRGLIV